MKDRIVHQKQIEKNGKTNKIFFVAFFFKSQSPKTKYYNLSQAAILIHQTDQTISPEPEEHFTPEPPEFESIFFL